MSHQPVDKNSKGFQAIYIGTNQTVSITGTSAQSSAFQTGARIVRLFATQDCFVAIGSNPTATTSDCFMPSGLVQYFGVQEGQKLAVIRSSSNGTLYITEGGP